GHAAPSPREPVTAVPHAVTGRAPTAGPPPVATTLPLARAPDALPSPGTRRAPPRPDALPRSTSPSRRSPWHAACGRARHTRPLAPGRADATTGSSPPLASRTHVRYHGAKEVTAMAFRRSDEGSSGMDVPIDADTRAAPSIAEMFLGGLYASGVRALAGTPVDP